jgi:oligosaccharide repeat unit polymerase
MRNTALSKANAAFVGLTLLFFTMLNYSYLTVVNPLFEYGGMFVEQNLEKLVISYVVVAIFALMLNSCHRQSSLVGLIVLATYVYIPILSFWSLTDNSNGLMWVSTASFVVVALVSRIGTPGVRVSPVNNPKKYLHLLFWSIAGVMILELGTGNLIANFSMGIDNVYERRSILSHEGLSTIGGYLISWFTKILVPIFFTYCVLSGKFIAAASLLSLQLVTFGLTGFKEQLFIPMFALAIAWSVGPKRSTKVCFLWIITIILMIAIFFSWFEETNLMSSGLLSRAFFSAPMNHFDYYQFFQNNPHTYWANSFLRGVIDYDYNARIPTIIGLNRWGSGTEAFANAGFIGSGYMHFGTIGVMIYSVLIGFLLKVFDILENDSDKPIIAALSGLATFQLVNGDLPAAILTHGIFIAALVAYLVTSATISAEPKLDRTTYGDYTK